MSDFFKSLDATGSNETGEIFTATEAGIYNLGAYGTWNGATVTFYVSFNETPGAATNGFTDSNVTFTEDGGYNVELCKGAKVWAVSTGGPTSVTAVVSTAPVRE